MSWDNFASGVNSGYFFTQPPQFFPQPEPEPDLLECLITGPGGGIFKTYLTPEELEELQGRYERIQRANQSKEHDRKKQAAEEARARASAQADWARIQENMQDFISSMGGFQFSGRQDGFHSTPPRAEPKTVPTKRLSHDRWRELCELAGVPVKTELTQKQLYRRAMRKCHPDTGGNHDLWLRLDKLKAYLEI